MTRDALREGYDAVYARGEGGFAISDRGWPRDRYAALVQLAGTGRSVLDVGCGDGEVLAALTPRFQFLAGIELSANRAANARDLLASRASDYRITEANIEDGIPYPDGAFDSVIWADVIEHVVDVFGAMHELARVLAPGGVLVTVTPNIAGIRKRMKLLRGSFPSTSGGAEGLRVRPGELFDGGHLHYFTYSSVEGLYRRAGLIPERRLGFGRFGCLHHLMPTVLSGEVSVVGRKP